MPGLSCGIWDLVPWPGIKLRTPALGAPSLSHWTTVIVREQCSCKPPPNKCYSQFWQERTWSPGTTVTLQDPVLAERRSQLAAPSGPGLQSLSNRHSWGSQPPRAQPALRPPYSRGKRVGFSDGDRTDSCCHEVAEAGMGQRVAAALRPGPSQWAALVRALEPAGYGPACSLGHQFTCWLEAGWAGELQGRRPGVTSYLPLHLMITTLPIISWAGPLTVAHWQLLSWGRGPRQHGPMAEQDH